MRDLATRPSDELYRAYYATVPWHWTTWRGTAMDKNPADALAFAAVIHRTRPELIVETGTFEGGSAAFFADLQRLEGLTPAVVTVDVEQRERIPTPGVRYLVGDSTDETVVCAVARTVRARRTMVVLDSDHTGTHVLAELEGYGELVSPGCYLVVEDSNVGRGLVEGYPDPTDGGPSAAIAVYLAGRGAELFTVDHQAEPPFSFNPGGWLLAQSDM